MFMRSSVAVAGAAAFSSSRLRCGDPKALLSPDRFNRRRKFFWSNLRSPKYRPNVRLPLWPLPEEAREHIKSIWDKVDLIKVSDVELEFLTESNKIDDESAMSLWHPNLKLLLITLGDLGYRYYTKDVLSVQQFPALQKSSTASHQPSSL